MKRMVLAAVTVAGVAGGDADFRASLERGDMRRGQAHGDQGRGHQGSVDEPS